MKCMNIAFSKCVLFWFFAIQLLKKHTLNPELLFFLSISCSKNPFKVLKICNINFWIENDPPPQHNLQHFQGGTSQKNHPVVKIHRQYIHEVRMSVFEVEKFKFIIKKKQRKHVVMVVILKDENNIENNLTLLFVTIALTLSMYLRVSIE